MTYICRLHFLHGVPCCPQQVQPLKQLLCTAWWSKKSAASRAAAAAASGGDLHMITVQYSKRFWCFSWLVYEIYWAEYARTPPNKTVMIRLHSVDTDELLMWELFFEYKVIWMFWQSWSFISFYYLISEITLPTSAVKWFGISKVSDTTLVCIRWELFPKLKGESCGTLRTYTPAAMELSLVRELLSWFLVLKQSKISVCGTC